MPKRKPRPLIEACVVELKMQAAMRAAMAGVPLPGETVSIRDEAIARAMLPYMKANVALLEVINKQMQNRPNR